MTEPPIVPRPTDAADAAGGSPASRLVAAGRRVGRRIDTVNLPVNRASSVLFETLAQTDEEGAAAMAGERHRSTYATSGTPITFALMDALAEIEGGGHACRAALMPSGLAAISIPLLAYTKPGDHVLMSDSVYGPARTFATTMLARFGVRTEFYPPTIGAGIEALIRPETRIVYLESPGSYTFEIQDVPAICAVARSRGVMTMIDNAWGSPAFARPFDWGVDVSLLPLTKYWGGHADLLMGAAVVREAHWPALWQAVRQTGTCVGGDDAFLVLRGLRTAEVRMRRHEATALEVARWLEGRAGVARVLHPALPSHPQHALWKRDFSGASGLFSFELESATPARLAALCERRRYFRIGYSWGGFESLIMPARLGTLRTVAPWTGGPLVRLHCGLEDAADLIADLDEGFAAMAAAG
ncbi:MAG TPA: cystathionine beta-lyase [Burkholderiaceae bacterium]|nr:cystathionine beta-lyase [Burkholderiaceae bacterium]